MFIKSQKTAGTIINYRGIVGVKKDLVTLSVKPFSLTFKISTVHRCPPGTCCLPYVIAVY
jgi:hypothetical protein